MAEELELEDWIVVIHHLTPTIFFTCSLFRAVQVNESVIHGSRIGIEAHEDLQVTFELRLV